MVCSDHRTDCYDVFTHHPMKPSPNQGRSKRLQVLDAPERAALYDRLTFTDEERVSYFTLSPPDLALIQTFTEPAIQAFFVLTLGYFKAKQRFFSVTIHEVWDDLLFISNLLELGCPPDTLRIPNPRTIQQQRQLILDATGYQRCHPEDRQHAFQIALQAARISPKPHYLLRIVLQYFATERIILPGYTYLQEEIIGKAITAEEHRLVRLLTKHLSKDDCAVLEALFEEQDGRYVLTLLQRAPKDLGRGELRRERMRGANLKPLYELACRVLPLLECSPDAIRYYASLVGVYTATRLNELHSWMVYVYLLCFLHHRYHRLHDHLLSGFMQAVKGFRDEAKEAAEGPVTAYRLQRTKDMVRAGEVLGLFVSPHIEPTAPFADVQAQAFELLDQKRLAEVVAYITSGTDCDETAFFWQHIDKLARRFKARLRPLLGGVELHVMGNQKALLEAVQFLQHLFAHNHNLKKVDPRTIPVRFIPIRLKRYLYTRSTGTPHLLLERYEFLVYLLVRVAIEAGDLVCHSSVRFRSIEDELIPRSDWQQHKATYLAEANHPILQQPIADHLAALEHDIEALFAAVNGRVVRGENDSIQIHHHGKSRQWSLHALKAIDPVNHLLFEGLPQLSLNQVMTFVDQQCGFLQAFDHVLGRYTHQNRDDRVLRACLIAWGTNLGLHRMGETSDISASTLVRVSGNYLRLETLQAANTILTNAMAALPLFRQYDLDSVVHSSSDGQKFETDRPTVNARHSPKYFGLGKGVVATTLVVNHVPVHARLISAHDHESHWVFDLLYNNPTDIQPTIHSTDTHGTNQVNFALLNVFGHIFAPRYADIQNKVRTSLYGFLPPKSYPADALFKPIRKINTNLIVNEWNELLRIFVSLARKTTSQSTLVTKLSSAKRRNRTLQALWEYDHIYATKYLLEYVDSPKLRRNVQRALNRGEQYHQLKRALSHANSGKLRYMTEEEQELWNEASRLLVNVILYYNMLLLQQAISVKTAQGDLDGAAFLASISPVAWHHINFYGRFLFQTEPTHISFDEFIAAVVKYRGRPEASEYQTVNE